MPPFEDRLKAQAKALGFELVGIAPAASPSGATALRDWLAKGHAGDMGYLHRHADAREHPRSILADVRSVVMVGMNYRTAAPAPRATAVPSGRISCYAWGDDYHDLLRERLNQLLACVQAERPGCKGRGVVDTAPLLERDFARLAGLGWFGKNTMLLHKRLGSFFFLGALLLDVELTPDPPFETSHCGTCTACLDACPTDAFVGPGELDARRCISYLTIELRGPIPRELREPMGDWIYGCDICQDVCPWNRKAPLTQEPAFAPRLPSPSIAIGGLGADDLLELLSLTAQEFRERFRGSPILRAKRSGFLRNIAIALGNSGNVRAVPALAKALADPEPVVRGAAAWALGRFDNKEAHTALHSRLLVEEDAKVRAELALALGIQNR